MRKNNSIKSRKSNGDIGKENLTSRSIASKNPIAATKMPATFSVARKTSPKNTTWMASLERFPEMGRQFDQAIQWFQAGKLREAARLLEKTIVEYPDHAVLLWYLGGIYRDLKDAGRAVPLYQKATKLAPRWEMPSLALFTSLWDTDQVADALQEMKRFQVLADWRCQDYLYFMDEISEKSASLANGKAQKKSKAKKLVPDTNPHAPKIGDAKKK